MRVCCVYSCWNSNHQQKSATFHRFPRSRPEIYRQWLINIGGGRRNWQPSGESVVCSDHFEEECFDRTGQTVRLRVDAVPTKNLPAHKARKPPRNRARTENDSGASTNTPVSDTPDEQPSILPADHFYAVGAPCAMKRKAQAVNCPAGGVGKKTKTSWAVAPVTPKIPNVEEILQDLRHRQLLADDALAALRQSLCGTPLELCVETLKNTKGPVTKARCPPELRAFAITLHFYSSSAYEYVRNTYDLGIPQVSTIRSWSISTQAEPGFTAEAFQSLRVKVLESEKKGKKIFCALLMDTMRLQKHVEWDGERIRGLMDIGAEVNDDSQPLATEVLVFMVVSLNNHWKLPCGYFLIHGMTGAEKANLVNMCLTKLHEIGVVACSLTCDGLYSNWAMFEALGVELQVFPQEITPWFRHPANSQKVFIFCDLCHLLKLLRSTLSALQVIKDPDGCSIRWVYIEELKKHQQRGLREGDKLRPTNLAAEVISLGVADALEFCATDLKIQTFADSEATVKFIRIFDTLYTMMNSRNRLGKGLKAPLKATTEHLWKPFFEAEVYILGLKDIHGQPLHLTILKTAFVGFLLAMKSFKGLFNKLLGGKKPPMRYLLTYKCSRDHLERFFNSLRRRGSWNDNPTARQFVDAYKTLLVRPKPPQPSGNCSTQDQTRGTALCKDTDNDALLNDHGTIRLLGMMVLPRNEDHDYADVPSIRTLALHVEDHDCLDVPNNRTLSLYVENVVEHLAVDVARTLQRDETCSDCLAVLQERRGTGDPLMPSSSVVAICKSTEKCLRRLEAKGSTSKGVVERQRLETAVGCAVLHDLLERRVQFFEDLDEHMFDTEPDDNHVARLTKRTALCYAKIRLHHQARSALWAQKQGRMVPTP
ncbi:hypothetical protein ISCGN_028000 [Ixodes scapularis]